MIEGRDSSYSDEATPAQYQQAYAAGVRIWWLYISPSGGGGLAHVADKEDFDAIKAAGMEAGAFCSGNDDPVKVKEMALSYGLRLWCLDVERTIRPDGPWVPGWLAAAESGLYGNIGVFPGRTAKFYIVSDYRAVPGQTWVDGEYAPNGPRGRQYRGGHTEWGLSVDSGRYDDYFAPGHSPTPPSPNPPTPPLPPLPSGTPQENDNVKVAVNKDGHLELFAIGAGGDLQHNWQDPNSPGGWSGWKGLGGSGLKDVTGWAMNTSGRLEVFCVSGAGAYFHTYQLATGGWAPLAALGTPG